MPWVGVISLLQQTPAEKCSEQIRPMLVLIPAPPPCSLVALGNPTGPPPIAFCLHPGPCPPPLRPGGGRARSLHTPPCRQVLLLPTSVMRVSRCENTEV